MNRSCNHLLAGTRFALNETAQSAGATMFIWSNTPWNSRCAARALASYRCSQAGDA
jgi:hypothetical protein